MRRRTFITIMTLLFGTVVSDVTISSKFTGNNIITSFTDVDEKRILINAKQIKHSVINKRWWIRNKIYYTYLVTSRAIDDISTSIDEFGSYPHMCWNMFAVTKVGHHLAINAHIDRIFDRLVE